jgi:diguanylate cyclase (GGDEF)-like protein
MMSLIRQVWLMLFGVLLIALIGSVATHTLVARQAALEQLQVRNDDGAMMLALALSQQQGDSARMQLVAAAQFDTGHYRRLRLVGEDGSVVFERELPDRPGAAPRWFARLLPVSAQPGLAEVSDGWRPIGRLQLWSHADWALDALWAGCLRMAAWLAVLGALAAAIAALAVRAWRRPLDATVAQAQALEERRFVMAEEPRVPELRRLTRSMNSLVRRLQAMFEQQAASLEEMRQQAHSDAVTGLPQRRHFVAQLDNALRSENQRGAGLVLVRLRHLAAMNQRIGHAATDRLLAALAQVLQSYPRHVQGALTGRLNGADFALFLPAAGMAEESARSLLDALRAALATVDREADLAIGGAELPLPCNATAALSLADGALAQAETAGAFALCMAPAASGTPVRGEGEWKARLAAALHFGRSRLMEYEVCDARGELLHLDCPMHLQLEPEGPFEPAGAWLAMAVRCHLVDQADLGALDLALQAIARDGRPRCINAAACAGRGLRQDRRRLRAGRGHPGRGARPGARPGHAAARHAGAGPGRGGARRGRPGGAVGAGLRRGHRAGAAPRLIRQRADRSALACESAAASRARCERPAVPGHLVLVEQLRLDGLRARVEARVRAAGRGRTGAPGRRAPR